MANFEHPFGRHPVDPYVSPDEGGDHYQCGCGCSVDLRVDVRNVLDTLVGLLKHPDHRHYREEFLEALGLPKEEKTDSG